MALKKLEFTPESGTVDSYEITTVSTSMSLVKIANA